MKTITLSAVLLLILGQVVVPRSLAEVTTIADVMAKGHEGRDSILRRILNETATDEEKEILKSYYQFLATQNPPKGSPEGWRSRVGDLQEALDAVIAGEEGSVPGLRRVTNCMACHRIYKLD